MPEIHKVKVIFPQPKVVTINILGINHSSGVSSLFSVGPWARFRSLSSPNGIALEVFDTGTSTWVTQWEYTQ